MNLGRLPLVAGWLAGFILIGGLGSSDGMIPAVLAIAAVTLALGIVVRVGRARDTSVAPGMTVRDFGSRVIRGVVPLLSDPKAPGRSRPRAPAPQISVA